MIICTGAGLGDLVYLTQRCAQLIRDTGLLAGLTTRAQVA